MANGGPQEEPKKQEKPKVRPDEREPSVYPSQLLESLRQTGLYTDTIRPVLGSPAGGIHTPPTIRRNDTHFARGDYDPEDRSVRLYNVRSEPAQHVNTLVHELTHSDMDTPRSGEPVPTYLGQSEEFSAKHSAYGLQFLRLLNEGMGADQAMSVVELYAQGHEGFSRDHVHALAKWWHEQIPLTHDLERRRASYPGRGGSQWEDILNESAAIQEKQEAPVSPVIRPPQPTSKRGITWNP